ncbi:MAG: DUF6288 domain-containing protein [Akkermansiaceae bacterium]
MKLHSSTNITNKIIALALASASLTLPLYSAPKSTLDPVPDFTKGDKIGDKHDWNLGPTGLRGWMWGWKLETTKADQIFITKVDKNSPADGTFQKGDIILGINDVKFDQDPRHILGTAIATAESTDGKLSLVRWRDGKTENVTLQLKPLGARSATSPYDCPKSASILEAGCEFIAAKLENNLASLNDPSWLSKGGRTRYSSTQIIELNDLLALLASGNSKYLELIQKYAHAYAPADLKLELSAQTGMVSWGWGYTNLFLSEYYLATGDKAILPAIKEYSTSIAKGQSFIGSWGHSMAWPELNKGKFHGSLMGYGALNSAGLVCHMSLVLAEKCNVTNDEISTAIKKANKFIGFYSGKGSIPYGDHFPNSDRHDDNGKNSMAAIIFDLQDMNAESKFFSAMTVASYGERERGHTGNYFSYQWGPLGSQRAGNAATTAFLNQQDWFYDLNRTWKGEFPYQGGANSGKGENSYSGWDSTSTFMLTYALPKKQLYITGKGTHDKNLITGQDLKNNIQLGSGFSAWDEGIPPYTKKTNAELLQDIQSWSPAVRTRVSEALALKEDSATVVPQLIEMLSSDSINARYGACQALGALKEKSKAAVTPLIALLEEDDAWLRIQAANALTNIGKDASAAIPALLKLATTLDPADPLQITQRFLAFGLFDAKGTYGKPGLLSKSVENIDRETLYKVMKQLLANPDGRTRGTVESLYNSLTFEELKPILPAILEAIREPSPSGVMFASSIRLGGLKMLAKYRVEEGMALCFDTMEILKWGKRRRVSQCLQILGTYGSAAKPVIPRLHKLIKDLENHSEAKGLAPLVDEVRALITKIENSNEPVKLRNLNS